ncbi:extracellular solute-binding protein [Saccharibacillus sp. CPCC 101409]|uniref:extracellular solute-binding protein n=1 Tax=Saccharibacillus sp. CPCC 101409 TaxID=3058041 RepID=UPI002673F8B5|nr:extracellular solute-binding protein [Saccharibacillus sp. CPCC 101409]MDO3411840.1 extracellular solute-binding protein [Saccharibacillus sp. CPCC 101409]
MGTKLRDTNKRVWSSVVLVTVLTTGVAGCTQPKDEEQSGDKAVVTVSNYDRGNIPAAEGTVEENRWTKWINENSPVAAKFVPVLRAEAVQKLNVMFASGSAPDIVNDYDTGFRDSLYQQKQLLPLDDYLQYAPEYEKLLEEYPQLRQVGTKSDGKLYEIGKINEPHLQSVMMIRTDWLKKLNLEVPRTTEEFHNVLKAFVEQDPDGNGKKDTYGANISYTSGGMIDSMFGAGGWAIEGDKIVRSWDNTLESLRFKKMMFDEGLIDKDYLADKNGSKAKQDYLNGKVGVYLEPAINTWFETTVTNLKTIRKVVPEAEIEPMMQPESPLGQFTHHVTNPIQMTTVINAAAKNPQAAMEYINFILQPDTALTLMKGTEGEHWKKREDGTIEVIDLDKNMKEVDWAKDYEMVYSLPQNENLTSVSAFDVNIPEQKAGLEMMQKADQFLLDYPDAKYPGLTHYEHMPVLPSDLAVINTNVSKETSDILVKGIIRGADYTPEQAIADAKAAWDKGGGKQIEEYMNTWYQENKDTAFLGDDVLETVRSQLK